MQIYLLLDSISALIFFYLGIIFFLKDPKRLINRVFFSLTLVMTIWAIASAGMKSIGYPLGITYVEALKEIGKEKIFWVNLWNSMGWIGIAFLPSIFLHLALVTTGKKKFLERKYLILLYFVSFIFLSWILLEEVLTPVILEKILIRKSFYIPFTLFFISCLLISFSLFIKQYFSFKSLQERLKLKYFIIGAMIPGLGGSILDKLKTIGIILEEKISFLTKGKEEIPFLIAAS